MDAMPIVYSDRPRVEELARNLYRIDVPMPKAVGPTNSYLFKADGVTDSGRSLLIDAGCDDPETKHAFDNALCDLGVSWDSVDVFITHFHWDHCAGLSRIWQPGMTVYGGVGDYAERGVPVMAACEIGEMERSVSAHHGIADCYDKAYWEPMTRSGTVAPPITQLHEGDVLQVGGYCLSVLETPGHDLHHLCLHDSGRHLFVGGDQVLYSLYPPVMVEGNVDQLSLLLAQNERIGKLDASLVLTGHGAEGNNLAERCEKIADHYRRQTDSFLALCSSEERNPGELAYESTTGERRTPWGKRSIFGRRSLIAQTMAYLSYFIGKGKLPADYDLVPLR